MNGTFSIYFGCRPMAFSKIPIHVSHIFNFSFIIYSGFHVIILKYVNLVPIFYLLHALFYIFAILIKIECFVHFILVQTTIVTPKMVNVLKIITQYESQLIPDRNCELNGPVTIDVDSRVTLKDLNSCTINSVSVLEFRNELEKVKSSISLCWVRQKSQVTVT